jgi:hypothetical protein
MDVALAAGGRSDRRAAPDWTRASWRGESGDAVVARASWPAMAGPITSMSGVAAGVSWTMRPSKMTRIRSDSASNSSRSSLTRSRAAPPLRGECGRGSPPPRRSRARRRGWRRSAPRHCRTARARAPRAGHCHRTASRWTRLVRRSSAEASSLNLAVHCERRGRVASQRVPARGPPLLPGVSPSRLRTETLRERVEAPRIVRENPPLLRVGEVRAVRQLLHGLRIAVVPVREVRGVEDALVAHPLKGLG